MIHIRTSRIRKTSINRWNDTVYGIKEPFIGSDWEAMSFWTLVGEPIGEKERNFMVFLEFFKRGGWRMMMNVWILLLFFCWVFCFFLLIFGCFFLIYFNYLISIQKISTWRPLSGHLNFDPVKIRGGLWVAKGGEVRGLESDFF